VIFVCENNHYAITTAVETSTAMGTFYQRAAGYGVPGVLVNGNDVLEVYGAAKEAVARARRGEGPTLIECDTYRLRGHHEGDEQTYRTRADVEAVKENNDCIKRMKQLLEAEFGWTEENDLAIYKSVEEQVAAAIEFGLNGTPMKVEDMHKNLFVDEEAQV
jgi:pyruvate dehydrogenase E1 component alpha subunit